MERKMKRQWAGAFLLALVCATAVAGAALAHQPFFENPDTTASTPMIISDPAISTALYATLDQPGDVDFFTFSVAAGQSIEIGVTIPLITGQENFAPTVGVIATGLDKNAVSTLPAEVQTLASGHSGTTVLDPMEAIAFFEPFSRTAYWRRQLQKVTFPAEGVVYVVVWHPNSSVGRYTLVVGQREVLGGESGFARKLREYWTPVQLSPAKPDYQPNIADTATTPAPTITPTYATTTSESSSSSSWLLRLLTALIGDIERCA